MQDLRPEVGWGVDVPIGVLEPQRQAQLAQLIEFAFDDPNVIDIRSGTGQSVEPKWSRREAGSSSMLASGANGRRYSNRVRGFSGR